MGVRKCPFMWGFTVNGEVMPIFCGTWQCPDCSKRLAGKWAKRVWFGCEAIDEPMRFWTLTMPGCIRDASYAYVILPSMFDSLRKAMQRAHETWMYAAFVEGQPKRHLMPHYHIITLEGVPPKYKRLKDFAVHYGFGYEAKDMPINSKGAAAYVSKYASKGDRAMPGNFRRVRVSQDWPELPDDGHLPYICQRKKETLSDFILRVSSITAVALDTLVDRWMSKREVKDG